MIPIPISDEIRKAVEQAEAQRNSVNPTEVVEVLDSNPKAMTIDQIADKLVSGLHFAKRGEKKQAKVKTKPINKPEFANKVKHRILSSIRPPRTLLEVLEKTIAKISLNSDFASRYEALAELGKPKLTVHNTYVAKIDENRLTYVESIEMLSELLGQVDENLVKREIHYYGNDRHSVNLFNVPLPKGYLASVGVIHLEDVPKRVVQQGDVFVNEMLGHMHMFSSHPPMLADKFKDGLYNSISLKINKSDSTLISWMPGLDPKHMKYMEFNKNLCILGSVKCENQ